MVYKEQFVVTVRHNNKVLREANGAVLLPFGSEYSISLKNLNSRRAVASISIDGQDVLDGQRIIVNPNDTTNVEGFLAHSGDVTHRFKFIEKTARISEHRGDKEDDGLIRVEYTFEALVPEVVETVNYETTYYRKHPHPMIPFPYPVAPWVNPITCGNKMKSYEVSCQVGGDNKGFATPQNAIPSDSCSETYSSSAIPAVVIDGITVKGGSSNQKFKSASVGKLEANSHVIVLSIKGYKQKSVFEEMIEACNSNNADGVASPLTVKDINEAFRITEKSYDRVTKPLTVKEKSICPTCGNSGKWNDKFCSECGTSLK